MQGWKERKGLQAAVYAMQGGNTAHAAKANRQQRATKASTTDNGHMGPQGCIGTTVHNQNLLQEVALKHLGRAGTDLQCSLLGKLGSVL